VGGAPLALLPPLLLLPLTPPLPPLALLLAVLP